VAVPVAQRLSERGSLSTDSGIWGSWQQASAARSRDRGRKGWGMARAHAADPVEVVVIGGGIAGASVGCFLALAGARVTILEGEPVLAHHTTGRSAAVYLENYGADPVRRLTLASRAFLAAPPPGLTDVPLLAPRGLLDVGGPGMTPEVQAHATRGAALVPRVRALTPEECVEWCPVLRPELLSGGVLEPDAQDIDVMALHAAFLRAVRARGGQVRTHAAVVALERAEGRWLVTTPSGTVGADLVVNAAGAWGDAVAGLAGVAPVGLRPLHRTAFIARLTAGVDARSWPLVQDLAEQWYFKPEGDALLCSLADEDPTEPGDAKPREEDVALALERINDATSLGLRHVRTAWAGQRTFVGDRAPVIGPDPDAPGFVWLVGLGGFGIMTAPAVGMLAASLALGRPLTGDLQQWAVDPADYAAARCR
jgi:D-arginine dehydrogenase